MRSTVTMPVPPARGAAAAPGARPGPGLPEPAESASDAAVIEQSWHDPERFALLFDRHADEIHRYAARRLSLQAAGDVVSEVFLAAFRNRGRYDLSRADARPWLYGISAKVISQQLRADGRRARAMAATPLPRPAELPVDDIASRIIAEQLRPRLYGVLAELSRGDRELVLLVAWAGLSYDEVAQALEIPLGTVRSRLHRVRARIRRSLGPEFDDKEFSRG